VIKRQDELDSTEEEIVINITSSLTTNDENEQDKIIDNGSNWIELNFI
jgi:hypothetical protein